MALVLFEPFIIRRLKELGHVHTVRSAKKMIERQEAVVWDILEEVTRAIPSSCNRAPTLHRLSIQAFERCSLKVKPSGFIRSFVRPITPTSTVTRWPFTCPLSVEAQLEARLFMMATSNIFSPSSGKPITTPTQDITLGCYYLTQISRRAMQEAAEKKVRKMIFADYDEVLFAHAEKVISTHDLILLRNPDFGRDTYFGDKEKKLIETSAGRVIFNQIWPTSLGFHNKAAGKKQLGDIILRCYQIAGPRRHRRGPRQTQAKWASRKRPAQAFPSASMT